MVLFRLGEVCGVINRLNLVRPHFIVVDTEIIDDTVVETSKFSFYRTGIGADIEFGPHFQIVDLKHLL